jgi:predicted RNA-binding Zn ribbon-like protein
MKSRIPVLEHHAFVAKDFVGGNVVLDFVNTVTGRNGRARDWLTTYADLANWAAIRGVLPGGTCKRLGALAKQAPANAAAALRAVRELRELLYRVLTELMVKQAPSGADLDVLHRYWHRSVERHVLRPIHGTVHPAQPRAAGDLNAIADALAIQAIDLLRALPTPRFRICPGPNCAWLFLDTSKGGRRRWCDMAVCGNRAKGERFHRSKAKKRQASSARSAIRRAN